ncbi:hypothetical protein EDB92DRAFT_896484 [Lactarius akahatsu]|uniref:Uncharacterized protein n=1 Tax=Lactarius akahatsu TaxID=416441 RepID=A0AAD4Q6Z1_9AGAM|nr:hypothetical protein EDB92DRAFT_896484 [Lactarius akahatsu]
MFQPQLPQCISSPSWPACCCQHVGHSRCPNATSRRWSLRWSPLHVFRINTTGKLRDSKTILQPTAPTMSFPLSSNSSASSPFPPYLSSPGLQRPRSRVYQDTPWQNFGDMRSDDPRPPVAPNQGPLRFHPRVSLDPCQNVDPSFSRPSFSPPGSYRQQQDVRVSGATMYQAVGSTADITAVHRHVPPYTYNSHPTVPSAGPFGFRGGQPAQALLWGPGSTASPQLVIAAPAPPPLPPLPLNRDPRAPHHYPAAQALDVDMIGWPHVAEGDSRSTRVPPAAHPRRPSFRRDPLVRVEDQMVWVRQDVLKLTLLLNFSLNADAEAHESWGPESPRAPSQ